MEPGLSGSFEICEECGEVLLPGAPCTHGPRGMEAALEEDQAMAGRLLGGKWRVLEPVGGGTFGTFWKGEHHILGMKVGIKVLRRYLTATPAGLRRFHEEAMRVSLLNHPGIVKLLDYGQEEDGVPYLVMEYLRGTPLNKYIHEKTLGLDDYVEIVSQVTRALIPAHRGEFTDGDPLVHLDLKPEHIFVERIEGGWHVKVIDFGLAEITGARREETGAGGGTPLYMGPERFRGVVDPRSDLYSLGIVLYECVAGCRPFESGHLSKLRAAHESQVPQAPGRRQGRLGASSSRKLDSIILSALAKDLDDRPRNAEEFLERLESWKRLRAAERESRKWSWRAKRVGAVSLGAIATIFFILWFAPGASVIIHGGLPGTVTLPRYPSATFSGIVRGFGYDDAPLCLELELEGRPFLVSLGPVRAGGEFHVKWPDQDRLASELGAEHVHDGEKFPGTLISRRMRRTVRGPSCKVLLDYKDPEIFAIRDASGAKLKTQARDGMLWVLIPPRQEEVVLKGLTVVSSEPLDLGACLVEGKPAIQNKSPEEFLVVAERRGKPIECQLVDLAGNKVRRELLLYEVEEVSIKGEGELHLTKERNHPIAVTVHGDYGHLGVLLDGEPAPDPHVQTAPGSREHSVSFTVPFKGEPGQRERRRVTFQAWSILGDATGKPDVELTVIVEWFERLLKLEVTRSGEDVPRLRALDSTGEEADRSRVEVEIAGVEGKIPCKEGVPMIPASMRGKLLGVFTAKDDYGNESDSVALDFIHPRRPSFGRARIRRGIGTLENPLHSADCACRPLTVENGPRALVIETAVDYAHAEDLTWEVHRVQGEEKRLLTFERKGSTLELPLKELLRDLDTGENVLRLTVLDRKDRTHLLDSKNVLVLMETVEPTVYPDSEIPPLDDKGKVELRIDVGGAHVESVTVAKKDGAEPIRLAGQKGVYRHRGLVNPHGYTAFIVEVEAGGRKHRVERRYHRLPVERLDYVFAVRIADQIPTLRLQFQRTSDEGQAFRGLWFSPTYLGAASSRAVTRSEAIRILQLVENRLKDGKWMGLSDRVRLPTEAELRGLLQRKLIEPVDGHLEWLEPTAEDFGPRWDAPYGEVIAGALHKKVGKSHDIAHRAAFRAIIEHGAPDSELEPCNSEVSE